MSIRAEWLHTLTNQCQLFIGGMLQQSDQEFVAHIAEAREQFAQSSSALEEVVRRSLLIEICVRHCAGKDLRLLHNALVACGVLSSGQREAKASETDARLAAAIRSLVDTHYAERMTLTSLSRTLHQHRNTLSASFRRAYSVSFHEYLANRRVLIASQLLQTTSYKVEAISVMVGYRSKKNFYREFERIMGVTPLESRHVV